MRRHFILFYLLVFFTLGGVAQNSPTPVPDTLWVSNIGQEHGLSQLNVLSFDFDENGYLWAGTEDGLNRFNGYSMQVYSQEESGGASLADDHIRGLLYMNDTLWLGTNTHSVQAYLLAEDRFLHFEENGMLPANPSLNYAHQIFEVNDRYLLASTLKNCILIDRKTKEFFPIPLPNPSVNDYVLSIAHRSGNDYYIGTYFNGILNLNTGDRTIKDLPDLDIFENNPVHALQNGNDKELYIGSERGLFQYTETSGVVKDLYTTGEDNPIRTFFEWDKEHYLIGYRKGLMFLNKSTNKIRPVVIAGNNTKDFSPVEILQIRQDRAKGIWMGTQGSGLLYYHPLRQKFTPHRISLPQEPEKDFISIYNFLRDKESLWMATHIGFVKHNMETNSYKLYRTNRLGYTIVKDFEENIWGGGFNQGLGKYNEEKDYFENVTSQTNIPDMDVAEITPLSRDSMWVSTWSSGIYSVNPNTLESDPVTINGKDLHRSRASYTDNDHTIWLGADDGLYRINSGKVRHYEHDPDNLNTLSNNRVFSITRDDYNNMWIGTAKGLNRINLSNDSITRYLQQPGLPNDFIYGVLSDSNNDVWVSTNRGLSRLNVSTGTFKNFTEKDGLQNNEFNGKAAYKDSLGYLYFGGMNGFNIFHPDSIPVNRYVGKTIIEEVELFGTSVDRNIIFSDTISFNYDENVITFHYTSLNFLLPEKNRYQFKMLGFDKDWRPITAERSTTYTNLNPGTYTFLVKGSNNDLVWGDPDSLTLTIRAPWYATSWFRIFAVLAVILVTTSVFMLRYNQKKAENLRLQSMVEVRTQELSKSNKELSLAINFAKGQKDNIAFLMQELNHRVKNNLQLIASLLDIQKESTNDELTRKNLQMAQNRLFTIATVHDLLSTKKPEEHFKINEFITKLAQELVLFMGAEVRLEFDLVPLEVKKKHVAPLGIIINELITNTLKHAFAPTQKDNLIAISLSKDDPCAVLRYHDNGKGIPEHLKDERSSLGINLIQNLSNQLKGEMKITDGPGTNIIIHFEY